MPLQKNSKGFTLVELMVALSLGLFLCAIALQQYQLLLKTEKNVTAYETVLDRVRVFRHRVQEIFRSLEDIPKVTLVQESELPAHIQKKKFHHFPVLCIQTNEILWLYLRAGKEEGEGVLFLERQQDKNALLVGIVGWEIEVDPAWLRFLVQFKTEIPFLQEWEFLFAV